MDDTEASFTVLVLTFWSVDANYFDIISLKKTSFGVIKKFFV